MLRLRLALSLCLALLAAPSFAAEPAWQTLLLGDGGASVEIPGESTLADTISDPELIASEKTYTVDAGDGVSFVVTVIDFKPESRENMSDDQYYTVGVDMVAGCMLRGFDYVSADDPAKGRKATYLCTGKNAKAEFHLKDLQLVSLVATGTDANLEGEAAKRFFSSFKAE